MNTGNGDLSTQADEVQNVPSTQRVKRKRSRGPYKSYLDVNSGKKVPESTLRYWKEREKIQGVPAVAGQQTQELPHGQFINTGNLVRTESPEEEFSNADENIASAVDNTRVDTLNSVVEDHSSVENLCDADTSHIDHRNVATVCFGNPTAVVEECPSGPAEEAGGEHNINNNDTENPKVNYIEKLKLMENIYHGLPSKKLDVLLMILHLAFRHCNTQQFVEDQIRFVNELFGENVLDISFYHYQKIFQPSTSYKQHYFCPDCEIYLGCRDDFQVATNTNCPNCEQNISINSVDSGNYFITLPLKDQIESLINRPGMRFVHNRNRTSNGYITDMFDGELYKTRSMNTFTVTFNTDGVAVFKSTKNSLWPIQLHLNEIVPELRFNSENLILGGLWFGRSAPNMALYLKPFIRELLDLSANGVTYRKPDHSVVKCPVYAIACSLDSVAKPKVVCQKQFNGYHSCLYCFDPNNVVDEEGCRHFNTSVKYPLRTEDQVIQDMIEADAKGREGTLRKGDAVNGFFGLSILLMFSQVQSCSFSIVWSVVIDYMHAILEGVTSDLLNLFLQTMTQEQVQACDERLNSLTPPQAMTQRPRSLTERVNWKAKEYRSFLLYYSLPCLKGLLPARNFNNLKLFVLSCHTLLSDKISLRALHDAEVALANFVKGFESLYGLQRVTYNLHLCTHLVDQVKKLGPLWCYSNFIFESGNGHLLKLLRGTRCVVHEIAVKFTALLTVSKCVSENPVNDSTIQFCNDILGSKYLSKNIKKISGVSVLGYQSSAVVDDSQTALLTNNNIIVNNHTVMFYNRAIRNGVVYCSKSYFKPKKFNDCCVLLSNGSYAEIDKILLNSNSDVVCAVRPIRIAENILPFLKLCSYDVFSDMCVVPFGDIVKKCVFMTVEDKNYVCHIPNVFERD